MSPKEQKQDLEETEINCQNCTLADLCLPHGMDQDDLKKLDGIVEHKPPYHRGDHLFRSGHNSHALFAVRSGALKSYCITEAGEEQVLGFILPGELTGMDGLASGRYASASIALETSSVCELPFEQLNTLCSQSPVMHDRIMRIVGKEITTDQQMLTLLGKHNAEERLASFILSLSSRFKKRGLSPTEFYLPMSRQDIGNYLGLAIETVSRLFARFQNEGILAVDRKLISIRKQENLSSMVDTCEKRSLASSV
ncbi:MAG: fumarate/nitrate reduction transcriptional regulator Fnr [Gammaproteobacteria bacterium]|nr:fumarate/nitrate reduction transcriptional regulator Fnr [Gammaproteobacteria bacterium]